MNGESPNLIVVRVISAAICVLLVLYVNRKSNRGDLSFTLTLVWTLAFLFGFTAALQPKVLKFISHISGAEVPANILFFASIFFLIVISFGLTLKVSRQSKQIIRLSQEIALISAVNKKK